MKAIKVGVMGFGTVGSGVVRLLTEQREMLARRLGCELVLAKVADLDLERPRPVAVDRELLTTRAQDILDDPEIDIVVELIGGLTVAKDYTLAAIERGKHVVTANKALLAHHGNDLLAAAAAKGVEIAFEAAVCGGIPIILALRQGLAANRIQELFGILNGTCNYILTQMSHHGLSYAQALAEAQAAGYAEADPTLDVEGIDTAHKLTILMSLAYGARLDLEAIAVEGISQLDPLDLQFAREFGYRLKLLAITRDDGHRVEARVHPTLIPKGHMLSQVSGAMNAVYLTGDVAGPILLYGQGAGMMPTASAVVSDILDLARNLTHGAAGRVPPLGCRQALEATRLIKPMNDLVTNYYF
ncbi:MAG: homoserine dehydrogenase, partial [Deltaproteobacteria bacterium]|nr:homoserine dehydrogenase [Deltaproteobacteria bacterium]